MKLTRKQKLKLRKNRIRKAKIKRKKLNKLKECLKLYKDDICSFVENYSGIELTYFQKEVLKRCKNNDYMITPRRYYNRGFMSNYTEITRALLNS